VLLQSSGLKEK